MTALGASAYGRRMALVVALALALWGGDVAANGKHCRWMLDTEGDQFERLVLADGYARVRMYDESFQVIAALMAEGLRPRALASAHRRLGWNHYAVGALAKARHHLLEVIGSGQQPACQQPWTWKTLAEVAFEMGRHAEAAKHIDAAQASHEKAARRFGNIEPLTKAQRLLAAKYWSHVDRQRALALVDAALATAAEPGPGDAGDEVDAAASAWIARLRQGEAPAEIPPLKRPWLEQPAPSFTAAEAMRRVEVWQERRWRLTRPAEQPGGVPREEWVTDTWRLTPGAIPPPPPAVVPLALHPPSLPALRVPTGPRTSDPAAVEDQCAEAPCAVPATR